MTIPRVMLLYLEVLNFNLLSVSPRGAHDLLLCIACRLTHCKLELECHYLFTLLPVAFKLSPHLMYMHTLPTIILLRCDLCKKENR